MKNEIILYRPNELAEHIEVRIDEETVWLSQQQIAILFNQTKQNISLHINNCFKEAELEKAATVKGSLTVQKEGSRTVKRKVEYYNLNVIISVGYRVKFKQGRVNSSEANCPPQFKVANCDLKTKNTTLRWKVL